MSKSESETTEKLVKLPRAASSSLASIIIVNYNGKEHISGCLESVLSQTYPDLEIIVVDNSSDDGSVRTLGEYKDIKLLLNETNLGFAKACNQGTEISKGGYIVYLNFDTVVEADWLEKLIEAAKGAGVGACMSKLLVLGVDPPMINSSGGMTHYLGLSWSGDYKKADDGAFSKIKEVAFASGAAMLVKREVIEKVGAFDEDYYMYLEDTDLSWRIRLAGYKVIFVPESIVWHKYEFSKGKQKFFYLERNRLAMMSTNLERRTKALLIPPAILFEIAMISASIVGGWGGLKMKSYMDIIKNRRRLKEKKIRVASFRRVSDREIMSLFTDRIDFPEINNGAVSIINGVFRLYWKLIYRLIR